MNITTVDIVLIAVKHERERQETLKRTGKFKYTCADIQLTDLRRLSILAEEFGEASREVNEQAEYEDAIPMVDNRTDAYIVQEKRNAFQRRLRDELIQTAAVCVSWVEHIDNNKLNRRR